MSRINGWSFSGNNLCAVVDGRPHIVARNRESIDNLVGYLEDDDADGFLGAVNTTVLPSVISDNEVEIDGDEVLFMGKPMHGVLVERMLELIDEGRDTTPYARFLSNLMRNPNKNSIEQLFEFLDRYDFVITEDGCFLGYKCVNSDLSDKYSGSFSNHVGAVVSMPRNEVSTDRNQACGPGLHVGAWAYSGFGGQYHSDDDAVLLVKVNPRDVCRVPVDHSWQKVACCEYTVVKVLDSKSDRIKEDSHDNTVYGWVFGSIDDLFLGDFVQIVYDKDNGERKFYEGEVTDYEMDDDGMTHVTIQKLDGEYRKFKTNRIYQLFVRTEEE